MVIKDSVYGKVIISEPVLIELIKSQPLQRLKGINQYGAPMVYPKYKATRFDHCVGVMILLKKFNATTEEQIAGLLHDVSHTAFSHTTDFVFGNEIKGDYHEMHLKKVISNSEIPSILNKYNYSVKRIINHSNYSLLENELPAICADRIDYTLRDEWAKLSRKEVKNIVDSLKVDKGEFVFTNKNIAHSFSKRYLNLSSDFWISPKTLGAFKVLATVLKLALQKKIISKKDLFTTDKIVLEKMKKNKDKEIQMLISLLNPKFKVITNKKNFHFLVKGKPRYIDPPVLINGKIVKVSKLYSTYHTKMLKFKKIATTGHKVWVKAEKNKKLKVIW